MAMIASLHVQDNMQPLPQQELPVTPEPAAYTAFDIFHDYFGLHTIVKSIAAENAPEESEELEELEQLDRRDSFVSSDSHSDFSSESVEVADICFNYNQEVRNRQAFSEVDVEPLSPLSLESVFEPAISKPNIPPSLFLSHTKITTITAAQLKKPQVCVFCRNNGESESFYTSHYLKDSEGKVTCPVLRAYTCPLCGANGDKAHTIKYCPENKESGKNYSVKRPIVTVTRKK